MKKSRMIYIAVLLIAVVVLIWDKTANRDSVSQPSTAQARPKTSSRRMAPAVGPKTPDSNPPEFIEVLPNIPPELMRSKENFIIRKTRNITEKLFWPPMDLVSRISDHSFTRDLFVATEEFLAVTKTNPPEPNPEPKPEDLRKQKIKNYWDQSRQLKLSGTLIGEKTSYAIINREVFFQGDHIGPYRLVEVKTDAVILEVDTIQIPLYLEQ